MNKHILKLSVIASAIGFASCGGDAKKDESTAVKNTGIDIANIDSTVKPTDDFYAFVNGTWLKNNTIPESESRWGSFNELEKKNKEKLLAILDSAAADKNAKAGSNEQKIGDFFSVAMDSAKLFKDGISPLNDEFTALDNVKTQEDLIKEIAHLHSIGVGSLFGAYVGQDPKISNELLRWIQWGISSIPSKSLALTKLKCPFSTALDHARLTHEGNCLADSIDQIVVDALWK